MIRSSSQFALVTPPSYAMSVFRLEPKGIEQSNVVSLNNLNRLFYERISARSDILLTRTELNGIFCIRFAVGAARTDETHIQRAFDLLCTEAESAIRTFENV
jgi:aromatic-L-amino-acid/L-tryptophan decarboxylase